MMISWWAVNGLETHDMEDSQGVFQVLDRLLDATTEQI
jgi:hypothetical protein